MMRFEIPPSKYSAKKRIWWLVGCFTGVALLVIRYFLDAENELRQFINPYILITLIIIYFPPIRPKKYVRFIEIDDMLIRWNSSEEFNILQELKWSGITRIKKLQQNAFMFFEENSFYRQLSLSDYTPNEQQVIVDTIKAYAERFSLPWVEEQSARAVA